MDVRIDPALVLGLTRGDAHVLRNAGGRVTDDVLRSLALSVNVLGVTSVVVMHHTECGLAATNEDLRARTGADVEFLPIDDHDAALADDVARIASTPYLERITSVTGLLYDVHSDHLEATPAKHPFVIVGT